MKKGIVIGTSRQTKDFLEACLDSCLQNKYPVLVVSSDGYAPMLNKVGDPKYKDYGIKVKVIDWNGFELGAIHEGGIEFDTFFYMPDTCVVKNQRLFDIMLGEESVAMSPGFMSYIGTYRQEVLKKIGVPKLETKREAVLMESYWTRVYMKAEDEQKMLTFAGDPLPVETDKFTEIYGAKRMVCENSFLIKYKGYYGGLK